MRTPKLAAAALAATLALTLAACSSGGSDHPTTPASADAVSSSTPVATDAVPSAGEKGSKDDPVVIGVVGASKPQWRVFQDIAEQDGIYVDIKDFTDYQQPNPLTTSGDLDINQFQHTLFLADYLNNSKADLVPIGSTAIYPLALYSKKYDSLEDIPSGAAVAVPNDGTNQARALGVLQSAGLLKLKAGTAALSATPEDIDTDASTVTVQPVAADQTARSLDDPSIAGAIINNDYVAETGLDPQTALAQDDPSSEASRPFINIWVTTAQNKDNPVYLKLVEISHKKKVEDALQKQSGGTAVLVHDSAADLQADLASTEQQLADQG